MKEAGGDAVTVVVSEQAADAVADKTSAKCRRRPDSDPSLVLSPTASFWRRPLLFALHSTTAPWLRLILCLGAA
jgi:hypothetical protein